MSNFLLNLSLKMLNIFQGLSAIMRRGDDEKDETSMKNENGVVDRWEEGGSTSVGAEGTGPDLTEISGKVKQILTNIAGPILIALGSVGVIYMVILGVQYAKSENDDKRATVKRRLVNLAIGVVAMFALATVCMAIQWDVIVPELFSYMKK